MSISGIVIVLAVVFNARAERKKGRIILRNLAADHKAKEVAA
jgi:rhamnose transport system permease protein